MRDKKAGYLEMTLRELHAALETQRDYLQKKLSEVPPEQRTKKELQLLLVIEAQYNRMYHWQQGITEALNGTYERD